MYTERKHSVEGRIVSLHMPFITPHSTWKHHRADPGHAINQTLCDKNSFLSTLQDNIATIITRESDQALADVDKRLEEQTELLKPAASDVDYDKVGDEIHRLRGQKQKLQLENVNREEPKKRIADMSTFLKKQSIEPNMMSNFSGG